MAKKKWIDPNQISFFDIIDDINETTSLIDSVVNKDEGGTDNVHIKNDFERNNNQDIRASANQSNKSNVIIEGDGNSETLVDSEQRRTTITISNGINNSDQLQPGSREIINERKSRFSVENIEVAEPIRRTEVGNVPLYERSRFNRDGNIGIINEFELSNDSLLIDDGGDNGRIYTKSDTEYNGRRTDYNINFDEFNLVKSSSARIKNNIEAIALLQDIYKSNRLATEDEQRILAKYTGWGSLSRPFAPGSVEYDFLKENLTKNEFEVARASTLDAYYTQHEVVNGIWRILSNIGCENTKILEPSAGIGNFLSLSKHNHNFVTVELDSISHKILSNLYQSEKYTHLNGDFVKTPIPENSFDMVLMNPPFGTLVNSDPLLPQYSRGNLQEFFVGKSIHAIRSGGLVACVVPRSIMDDRDETFRKKIAMYATLKYAVRLPSGSFAGTDITTDLLIFQKREIPLSREEINNYLNPTKNKDENDDNYYDDEDEILDNLDLAWIKTVEIPFSNFSREDILDYDKKLFTNKFYTDFEAENGYHKGSDLLIGSMQQKSTSYGYDWFLVNKKEINIADEIYNRFNEKSQINFDNTLNILNNSEDNKILIPIIKINEINNKLRVGSFYIDINNDLAIMKIVDKELDNFVVKEVKDSILNELRIRDYITIRDILNKQIELESNNFSDTEIENNRESLNLWFDKFTKKNIFFHLPQIKRLLKDDPDFYLVMSLEKEFDKGVSSSVAEKEGIEPKEPSITKADILFKRVIYPAINDISKLTTSYDGLIYSLQQKGNVDLDFISSIINKSKDDIIIDLKGQIFLDPTSNKWEYKTIYAKGNVREKLELAKVYAKENNLFLDNISFLEKNQPEIIPITDIAVSLGVNWIPVDTYSAFFSDLFSGDFVVSKSPGLNTYTIKSIQYSDDTYYLLREEYGTNDLSAIEIATKMLNFTPLVIKVPYMDDEGKKKYKIDQERTLLLKMKSDLIKDKFKEFVINNEEHGLKLENIYNNTFNVYNDIDNYDGIQIQLHNSNSDISLRSHQHNAIFKALIDGRCYFDHTVGAGKTLVCSAVAIEGKHFNRHKKPMIAVPNHLTEQWRAEINMLYPSANILVLEPEDFNGKNLVNSMSQIAFNSWDCVVIPHSSILRIPPDPLTAKKHFEKEVSSFHTALDNKEIDGQTRRNLEKAIKLAESKLEKAISAYSTERTAEILTFAELGVDALFVDEAHLFKNLAFTTTLNVSGLGNPSGSKKCTVLKLHCDYIKSQHDGMGIYFASGTPISNSITELYNIFKYFDNGELEKQGIFKFDDWARVYGEVVQSWEIDTSGQKYVLRDRFSKFNNVPELIKQYKLFADVVVGNDLPELKNALPLLEKERPIAALTEATPVQTKYIGEPLPDGSYPGNSIIGRMEAVSNREVEPDIDNYLKITSDAKKCSLDARILRDLEHTPDFPESKIRLAAKNIVKIYKETNDFKGTQMVFCDMSVSPTTKPKLYKLNEDSLDNDDFSNLETDITANQEEDQNISLADILAKVGASDFNVYDEIKRILVVENNIPENEIQFIQHYKNPNAKQKLFKKVNDGDVRVILGSTSMMGAGTNAQYRLSALHHLDAPWRPSDLEQREGRILRQGNLNNKVAIFRYATEKTFDARSWQILESKAKSIQQFRKGQYSSREFVETVDEVASASEMKAVASGNPMVLWLNEISQEIKTLESLKKALIQKQYTSAKRFKSLTKEIPILKNKLELINKDLNYFKNKVININPEDYTHQKFISDNNLIFSLDKEIDKDTKIKLNSEFRKFIEAGITRLFLLNEQRISIGTLDDQYEISLVRSSILSGYQFVLKSNISDQEYFPQNLRYEKSDSFSVDGFFTRLKKGFTLDFIERLHTTFNDSLKDKEIDFNILSTAHNTPFEHDELLHNLKQEKEIITTEIKKVQADSSYISDFKPVYLAKIKGNSNNQQTQIEKPIKINIDTDIDFSQFFLKTKKNKVS